jgi:hypothetical protein
MAERTADRTVEQVSREIELEREQLAGAVGRLRREVADVRAGVRRQLPRVLAVAVVVVGIAAAIKFRRRAKRPQEVYRIGRFAVIDYDS